jgi:hypothetical protein
MKTGTGTTTDSGFARLVLQAVVEPVPIFITRTLRHSHYLGVPIMPCRHLRELFEVCREHQLRLSSSDLIRIVCPACGVSEECPSVLCEEYENRHRDDKEDVAEAQEDFRPQSAKD